MDLKEQLKRVTRVLLYGTIWVYVLSIPLGDKLLFDHAYELLVENSVVDSIHREAKSALREAKVKARSVLADSDSELPQKIGEESQEF